MRRCGFILGVFPSNARSMYIVEIWPTGMAGGRAVPHDVREEPGGALYVHSPCLIKADVFLQCLTTLVNGGNGLSRAGGNLGCMV